MPKKYVFKEGGCCTHETDMATLSRSGGGDIRSFWFSLCVLLSALTYATPSSHKSQTPHIHHLYRYRLNASTFLALPDIQKIVSDSTSTATSATTTTTATTAATTASYIYKGDTYSPFTFADYYLTKGTLSEEDVQYISSLNDNQALSLSEPHRLPLALAAPRWMRNTEMLSFPGVIEAGTDAVEMGSMDIADLAVTSRSHPYNKKKVRDKRGGGNNNSGREKGKNKNKHGRYGEERGEDKDIDNDNDIEKDKDKKGEGEGEGKKKNTTSDISTPADSAAADSAAAADALSSEMTSTPVHTAHTAPAVEDHEANLSQSQDNNNPSQSLELEPNKKIKKQNKQNKQNTCREPKEKREPREPKEPKEPKSRTHQHDSPIHVVPELCRPLGEAVWLYAGSAGK